MTNNLNPALLEHLKFHGYDYAMNVVPTTDLVKYKHVFCNGLTDIFSDGDEDLWHSYNHDGSISEYSDCNERQLINAHFPILLERVTRTRIFIAKPMEFRISRDATILYAIGCNNKYEITFAFKEMPDGKVVRRLKVAVGGVFLNLDDEFKKRDADQNDLNDVVELCNEINQTNLDDIIYANTGKYNWTTD